jgi:hypothetical protein
MFPRGLSCHCVVAVVVAAVVVGDDDAIALYCYSTVSTKSCQGSISLTFYAKLLCVKVPKAQKILILMV